MPGRDGTGPFGQGPAAGRGAGRRGTFGAMNAGPGGYCVCPGCGEKVVHTVGTPCASVSCPKCGARMTRGL